MKTETKQTHTNIEATVRKVRAIAGLEPLCDCENKIVLCSLHLAAPELLADAKANAEWFEREGYHTEAANIRKLIAKAEGK